MTFGEQVIAVLERDTRRWRYWAEIWEYVKYWPPEKVKRASGWTKEKIESEMHLALSEMLLD